MASVCFECVNEAETLGVVSRMLAVVVFGFLLAGVGHYLVSFKCSVVTK